MPLALVFAALANFHLVENANFEKVFELVCVLSQRWPLSSFSVPHALVVRNFICAYALHGVRMKFARIAIFTEYFSAKIITRWLQLHALRLRRIAPKV